MVVLNHHTYYGSTIDTDDMIIERIVHFYLINKIKLVEPYESLVRFLILSFFLFFL